MKIKPCPFCGHDGEVATFAEVDGIEEGEEGYAFASSRFVVVCNYLTGGCGASTGGAIDTDTPEKAIERWNRRTQPHGNI